MKNKKKLILVPTVVVLILGFIGLLIFAIYDAIASEKSIVRLGDYSELTYTASDRDTAGTQVVDLIVERTRFGGVVKTNANKLYEGTMSFYQKDADEMGLTIEQYVELYLNTDMKTLKKTVKDASLLVAKEEAVLNEIADREKIFLTSAQFNELVQKYMDSVGYTDLDMFLDDYNEDELRVRMRQDITIDFLLKKAQGPALTD